jgi:hypothetical protein
MMETTARAGLSQDLLAAVLVLANFRTINRR